MHDERKADSGASSDVERDLEQRLRLVTPRHTTRGILFKATLKAVRELGGTEDVVRQCLEATGEKEFLDFFNYPTSALLRLLTAAGRGLSSRYGSVEESLRQLGWKSGESYMASVVGRSAQLMNGTDPKQWVGTLQTLYKVVMPYGEPTVHWRGPKRSILAIQCTFTPLPYHEGGALAIAGRLGVENVRARARPTGELSIDLDLSWD
ncbi:DUF2378 family protein [Archangium violaceum]|uniref:DUF2378 family protein n=1 Tax=Archangium violaceum TaxID=83451 RepID=UPI00195108F7|nr:DUF2378 family protein [Archangium violaceum]QRN95658.1 DUF2378 family protein [Archangium violaceum]